MLELKYWTQVTGGKILELGGLPSVKHQEDDDLSILPRGHWTEYDDGVGVYMEECSDHYQIYFRVGESVYTSNTNSEGEGFEMYEEMDRIIDAFTDDNSRTTTVY